MKAKPKRVAMQGELRGLKVKRERKATKVSFTVAVPEGEAVAALLEGDKRFDRLVCFVYLLLRDHLPSGSLQSMRFESMADLRREEASAEARRFVFSNRHVEAQAREIVADLLKP